MINLKAGNHLVQYLSPFAAGVDPKFKDAEGYYTGARLLIMGITFSTTSCSDKEAPYNWDGLLAPNFNKQLIMTDPTGSGSTKALVYAMTRNPKYGWDYFKKWARGTELQSSGGDKHAVAAGSYKVAFGVITIPKTLWLKVLRSAGMIPRILSPCCSDRNSGRSSARKACEASV
jgi:iron(III) transport system substrate-binding protein